MQPAKAIGRPKRKELPGPLGNIDARSYMAIRNSIMVRKLDILNGLFDLAFKSENEKTRLEALQYLGDKMLANAHNINESTPDNHYTINLIPGGYIPPTRINGSSNGSLTRPTPVQGPRLAPARQKNIDSYNASHKPGNAG